MTLTGTDLARLSTTLGLSARDLLGATDFYILNSHESVPEGLHQIPQVNTEQGPAFVALKKQKDGDCIFLEDNLCMVHAVRPSVCASFPFVFERKGPDLSWGLSAMKQICPGLGKGPQVQDSDLVSLGTEALRALALYKEFVEMWNKTTKAPTALDFIESVLKDQRFSVQ